MNKMFLFIYNLIFPLAFLFFLPGLLYKLARRPGHKRTFAERFSIFSAARKRELAAHNGAVWVHAVSVGETMIALSLIKKWLEASPDKKFVLSSTTTTGQALARSKLPPNTVAIYCPIDFHFFVKKTMSLFNPRMVVILETEIWPNMITLGAARCKVAVVNARMSDKSFRGYSKARIFIGGLLSKISLICAQSEADGRRFAKISGVDNVRVTGNMKFDQEIPASMPDVRLGEVFGPDKGLVLLAASTHPGEEKLVIDTFERLKKSEPGLKLVIAPRHAERGSEIESILRDSGLGYLRRSTKSGTGGAVDCLLADTTGELLSFMAASDIVIMGKSLAGHDEGHNLIEPALIEKPIVTGPVLKNFRFVLNALKENEALATVDNDAMLEEKLMELIKSPEMRRTLGTRAREAISVHKGAIERTISLLENLR